MTTGTRYCSREHTWEVVWEEARVTGQGWTFPRTALTCGRAKKDPATVGVRWSICSRESNHCSSLPAGPPNLDAEGSLDWHRQGSVAAGSTRAKETPVRAADAVKGLQLNKTITWLKLPQKIVKFALAQ